MCYRQKGFGLIELMVTIAIVGIIMSLALPSLSATYVQSRINSNIFNLSKDLVYARSMAVSNQLPVVICNLGTTTCNEDGWANGYTIFLDINGNGQFDSANDTKLRVNADFDYGTLSISNGADELIYSANGRASATVTFTFCPFVETNFARGVVINAMGRSKLTQDYDGDGLDETSPSDNNSHLTCS
ncbi:GspH/FimT family pseudopilin [Saccharobesus litoralis]|nr:GspH/FimT family pseudopilin [Saccharobesus litoralis]